jgi:hypothetical protein
MKAVPEARFGTVALAATAGAAAGAGTAGAREPRGPGRNLLRKEVVADAAPLVAGAADTSEINAYMIELRSHLNVAVHRRPARVRTPIPSSHIRHYTDEYPL